jgi:peptide/nickel transport system permease protein
VLRAIIVKTATAAAVLFAVSVIVFFGTEALPGDAAEAALGQTATPQLLEQYRKDFGLDRPVLERYEEWASGMLQGDLGRSLPSGDPVSSVISDRIANTAILSLIVLILLVPLSMLLGTLSALRRDSAFDHVVTTSTLSIIALPEFVVGAFLIVIFSTWTGLLPPVSLVDPSVGLLAQPSVLILPVLTLLAAILGQTTRMVRACMIDVLGSDYVEMSRLKGVPERRVLLRHALPNAMGPTIQVLVLNVAWLAGGVVIAEKVFEFPGLGLALANAVSARDIATVQAIVMLITATYLFVTLLADLLEVRLDPRLARAR